MAGATRTYIPVQLPKVVPAAPFPASSREKPLDALMVGAGPTSIISARNLQLKGITNIVMCDREDDVGGGWYRYWGRYSSLQVLKSDWKVHGVEIPGEEEPVRRASSESVCNWVC